MKPIFLISLPRSGSTLLQRILSTSSRISTTSEPWINLGIAQLFGQYSGNIATLSNFSFSNLQLAVKDFTCVDGRMSEPTRIAVGDFISRLYASKGQCPDVDLFLDKTPRYYYIVDFLADVFPDAKFIFLTRNLDAVAASIFTTWYNNRYMLYHHYADLDVGPELIKKSWDAYSGRSILVKYENLLDDPASTLDAIENYLGLEKNELSLNKALGLSINGTMGDPTGQHKYKNLRPEPAVIDFYSHIQRARVLRLLDKKTPDILEFFGRKPSRVKICGNVVTNEIKDLKGVLFSDSALYLQKILSRYFYKIKHSSSCMKLS